MKYLAGVASIELSPACCTGCGMCVEVCPHEVFALRGGKATVLDKDRCIECGACLNNCAFGALSVEKGAGCATALINEMLTGGEASCCGDRKDPSDCS